jgi:hypothetical protein
MKKQILVTLLLALALALTTCDDGTKKETPSVPKPTQKTLTFDGNGTYKVTISSPDEHLPSAWNALCNDVVTALESAYESASGPSKGRFENVFANNANAQIVLVNNLANNWEVKDGEFRTLYLKTGSIATATYGNAVQLMASNSPSVG